MDEVLGWGPVPRRHVVPLLYEQVAKRIANILDDRGVLMHDEFCKIQKKLKKELDKDRFEHTLGVMYTAACLAMRYGCDMEQARMAGLLHDCAKCIPDDEKKKLCEKYHIELSDAEKKNSFLIHAKLGAVLAKKEYDINDEEILHAISVHTTGAPRMNLLDKIIFVADYIEPNRNKAKNLGKIRALAFENLDVCMLSILEDTLLYLKDGRREIDPMTKETYLFMKEQCCQ